MMEYVRSDELTEIDLTEDEIDAMMAAGEPVEVTGPFDPIRRVRFELITGGLHAYRWRIVAANGEILAVSANQYQSREDVRRAVLTLAKALREAPVTDIDDTDEVMSHRLAS